MNIETVDKVPARLLWVDLEMTGLDPAQDRILEVAAIATDWNFKEIATYEAIIKVDKDLMEKRMVSGPSAEFYDKFPEVRTALMIQNNSGKNIVEVEDDLLEFIKRHFDENERVILAGNSIHQDRRFIRNEWRRLDARLHYRMLDVSAWKVIFEGKYRKKFAKPETHRALADIRGSIEELQYYLKKVKA